jgi:hypothetical protein
MRFRRAAVILFFAVGMGWSGRASGDPVTVSGGVVALGANGSLSYDMVTAGVSLLSNSPLPAWSDVGYSLGCAMTGCTPGQVLSFNNQTAGTDFFGNPDGFADLGSATVDTDCCGSTSVASLRAHWTFVSEGAAVPTSGSQFLTISAPFAFRGSYDLSWCDASGCGGLFMRRVGGGLATIQLQLTDNGYVIRPGTGLSYSFSASATPEPASLVLLGTGVAGLMTHRRRRQV